MILPKFQSKLTDAQIQKTQQIAFKLGISPNWLLAVSFFETAGTLSPSKRNSIGSVGLIQFTRDKAGANYKTIQGKRYPLDDIAKMTFIQQLDLVYLYLNEVQKIYKVNFNSFLDVYLAVFFPLAIGKLDSFVLATKYLSSSLISKQNPIFDQNKDGQITKSEVLAQFSNYYGSFFEEIKKKV